MLCSGPHPKRAAVGGAQAWGEGGQAKVPWPLAGLHSFGSTPSGCDFPAVCLTVCLSFWAGCCLFLRPPMPWYLFSALPHQLAILASYTSRDPFKALATACHNKHSYDRPRTYCVSLC